MLRRAHMIRLEHVSKVYRMGEMDVPVLRDIDLDVPEGQFLVAVGPSGSGKSTLLNLIGGIDAPTTGRVLFRGAELGAMSEGELTRYRREEVGFIFQFYNLIPTLTALENVAVCAEIAEDPVEPAEALGLVGLAGRSGHFPAQLSGGEQQRVAVARALCKNPSLILCDEPTGALDLTIGREVLSLLAGLNRDHGKTVILITHNTAIAAMADRVVHLGSGAVESVQDNPHPVRAEEVTW